MMNPRLRIVSLLSVLGALSFAPCLGQDQVSVKAAMIPIPPPGESVELWMGDRSPTKEVKVGGPGFSEPMTLPRLEQWRFGHTTGKGGKKQFEEIGQVSPPPGSQVWLVFCQQREESGMGIEPEKHDPEEASPEEDLDSMPLCDVLAIEAGEDRFPGGSALVVNRSTGTIDVEINGETVEIEAGGQATLRPPTESLGNLPVRFHFDRKGKKRLFISTNWSLSDNRRRLAVVVPGPEGSGPRLVTVDETLGRRN